MQPKEEDILDDTRESELISACRTTIGDQLRSITYFTENSYEQIYLRSDLEADADLSAFVEYESWGFDARTAYTGSELGTYQYTIRVFDNGFLVRVTTPTEGVFLTTDGVTLHDFDEMATAVGRLLAGLPAGTPHEG